MQGRVGAVVALKPFHRAKTRITGLPADLRAELVRAMALDTLTALHAAGLSVLVISVEPSLREALTIAGLDQVRVASEEPAAHPDHGGLNRALSQGDQVLRGDGCRTVLACVADLPALRTAQVHDVLRTHHALSTTRSFLPDADGVGTTLLVATGVDLDPLFQGGSAERHRGSGAVPLIDPRVDQRPCGARQDVDDLASLAAAVRLGVGQHTRAVLTHPTLRQHT